MATRDIDAKYQEVYKATYEAYLDKPQAYFSHDTNAHRDDGLRRLVRKHGIGVYGRWWLLVELLTEKKGHIYHIGDEEGLEMLREDMSLLESISRDELKDFLDELAKLELIDTEMYGECKVTSSRVMRNVVAIAETAARKAAGGAYGGRPRKNAR